MTKDEIMRLAREAGLAVVLEEHASEYGNGTFENTSYPELERFANLVAEHEREECAKVCEAQDEYGDEQYAKAIRARGTT